MTTKNHPILLSAIIWFAMLLSVSAQRAPENLEIPKITKRDLVVKHQAYTLSFCEKYKQAYWVAYHLTADETHKLFARSDKFTEDPLLQVPAAENSDYKGSGYDKGHLAPAADMGWREDVMRESFYLSNMSPQAPAFNRGGWKHLEELVRYWAQECGSVYVVTGPVFQENMPAIGAGQVAVPGLFYKVILRYDGHHTQGIGFLMPNQSCNLTLQQYAVPIDSVEKVARINFFPALPDEQERVVEKTICLSCWNWEQTASRSYSGSSASAAVSVQCSGITKAGARCKRKTSRPSGRCAQHENQN